MVRAIALALILLAASLAGGPGHAREGYVTRGTCDGFPRVSLKTSPGLCVGLVATKLGFPRGLALIGSDLYVTDLASRTPGRGRVLRLANYGRGAPQTILSGLNQPNGIAATRDGFLYVGEVGRLIRFDPKASNPRATVRVVLAGLPQDGRHNLTAFTLAPDAALIINVGSFSDNCERIDGSAPDPRRPCPERSARPPRGALLRHSLSERRISVLARGIRNAMAFAYLPDGTLMAASNGRDNIDSADPALSDEALPHDVLLAIKPSADYGWPYCFDDRRQSPEYPSFDCRKVQAPVALLAPHAAPLGMIYYAGNRLPGLSGKLVLAYHGYRARGHRIVTLAVASGGRIVGAERDIVAGWTFKSGIRPQGFPSALLALPDGSILVAEDQNRSLLRISRP
jgi:glucose/arabinose dehydrogenase